MTLEAAKHSAEGHTTATQSTASTAATERDALATMLVLTKAEIEKLHVAAASTNEAAERATAVAAAAVEATARDTA
jgi:hypothetical protein